jgi:hypothetical protein
MHALDSNDAINGCILGALLGDTTGSYLEFSKVLISPVSVEKALTLPGGGAHNVAPG